MFYLLFQVALAIWIIYVLIDYLRRGFPMNGVRYNTPTKVQRLLQPAVTHLSRVRFVTTTRQRDRLVELYDNACIEVDEYLAAVHDLQHLAQEKLVEPKFKSKDHTLVPKLTTRGRYFVVNYLKNQKGAA